MAAASGCSGAEGREKMTTEEKQKLWDGRPSAWITGEGVRGMVDAAFARHAELAGQKVDDFMMKITGEEKAGISDSMSREPMIMIGAIIGYLDAVYVQQHGITIEEMDAFATE
jgi:hypothetical protein